MVEVCCIVILHTLRQDLSFPGIGRNLEALQLTHNLKQTAFATELGAGRDMLPPRQPAHELRGSGGLDLLPQYDQREAMNARQQTAIAPLGHAIVPRELAAQD